MFIMRNEVGLCTHGLIDDNVGFLFEPSMMNYCICCGDHFEPDASLNCPQDPWQSIINKDL